MKFCVSRTWKLSSSKHSFDFQSKESFWHASVYKFGGKIDMRQSSPSHQHDLQQCHSFFFTHSSRWQFSFVCRLSNSIRLFSAVNFLVTFHYHELTCICLTAIMASKPNNSIMCSGVAKAFPFNLCHSIVFAIVRHGEREKKRNASAKCRLTYSHSIWL